MRFTCKSGSWASEIVCVDDLSAGDGSEGASDGASYGALDEPHGAIAEENLDAAGVVTAGSDGGEGAAAGFLTLAVDVKDRKIEHLQAKLVQKNEVIAELMEEHVKLKKELGEP
jgi:hypothetical protein